MVTEREYRNRHNQYPKFWPGIVVDVDPENRTYSFIATPQMFPFFENVSYAETTSAGFGQEEHPFRMQNVIVIQQSESHIVHMRTITPQNVKYDEDGFPTDRKSNLSSGTTDTRAIPGDFFRLGKDGERIGFMRGGVAMMGASDMAQILFFASENLIRMISENYESFSDAGRMQVFNDDGKVTTRITFSDEDIQTYKAAQILDEDNGTEEEYPDYFPLQVDIGSLGEFVTMYLGEIVDDKRQNRIRATIKKTGETSIVWGSELHDGKKRFEFKIDPKGSLQILGFNDEGDEEIYRKEVVLSDERSNVREVIVGNKHISVQKGSFFEFVAHKKNLVAKMFSSARSLIHQRIGYAIDDAGAQKTTKLKSDVYSDDIM
ncbi:MAG: hypothetical protein SVK08_00185 [Halobacteriota archaeon]|nr:hypothetical protein [Halobacteriota archaeon]